MDLVKHYIQTQIQQKQSSGDIGIDYLINKQYDFVNLGSLGSIGVTNTNQFVIQQRLRAQYLKMLFAMSPSANQAGEKIVSCVMSNGWTVRPVNKNKKHDTNRRLELINTFREMDLTSIMKFMLWARMTYGDTFIYTPFGNGKKKDIAVKLHPLDNIGMAFKLNSQKYWDTGVIDIDNYIYEIVPLEGSISSSNTTRKVIEYDPKNIIRWTRKTHYNPVYGTANLEEDQATLMLGLRVLGHNLRFFQNSAKPPVVFDLGENMTYDRAMEFKKTIDSRYKGAPNQWETMVIWGGAKITELKLPDSTQFMDMLTYVRIQVCGLLSVPPNEIGVVDRTGLNTSETAHKDFIKTNINATKLELGQHLTYELLNKRMGIDDFEIYLPPMDSMTEKQRAETNRVMIESGQMTIDEARETIVKDIINEPWAQMLLYGNTKGPKTLLSMDSVINQPVDQTSRDNGKNGINTTDNPKQSGRTRTDGRINTNDDSIN
jgi:HK97 family phage portal protein